LKRAKLGIGRRERVERHARTSDARCKIHPSLDQYLKPEPPVEIQPISAFGAGVRALVEARVGVAKDHCWLAPLHLLRGWKKNGENIYTNRVSGKRRHYTTKY